MKGREIRQSFLEYFASKGHKIIRSGPLVPAGDPTLLFANAGMVQFKNVFLGQESVGTKRATTSQKCLRVSGKHNDFENVGRTPRHHTFFEMLGNFSFGDYFKRDAITFAWEYLTGVLGISPDRLTATIFEDDDEAGDLWAEISGLPPERIVRMGAADNFWQMGDTGPCGPCTEIHYQLRPEEPGGIVANPENFMEIWNLVFMQFDRGSDGTMKPLPAPSVDTGAGLERVTAVMQNVPTNFDTDLFAPIRAQIADISGKTYGAVESDTVSMRVICDHSRAIAFLVGDAVLPSNLGRGYVLRRIMRRAARHGVLLGISRPFLYQMIDSVIEAMRDAYPELEKRRGYIAKVVKNEEDRFLLALEKGLKLLNEFCENRQKFFLGRGGRGFGKIIGDPSEKPPADIAGDRVIYGDVAFLLHDTFGFNYDLIEEHAKSLGFIVDLRRFNWELDRQREKSRKGGKFDTEAGLGALGELSAQGATTRFLGYDSLECEAEVLGILKNGDLVSEAAAAEVSGILKNDDPVSEAAVGDEVEFVTDATPFYAEKGGQVGDTGRGTGRVQLVVLGTRPAGESLVAHRARIESGTLRVGEKIRLRVDEARRNSIRRNHTATHLLHYALRRVLGEDAKQAGSLVSPDYLRFDFSHFQAVTDEELREVERIANEMVLRDFAVNTEIKPYEEAVKSGAMALFGEKYEEKVRVVTSGDSRELCGGTHVVRTGEIGPIVILHESSIAAGVRRIEALSGAGALSRIRAGLAAEKEIAHLLKTTPEEVVVRTQATLDRLRQVEKEAAQLREKLSAAANEDLIDKIREVRGVRLLAAVAKAADANALRALAVGLRDKIGSGVIVLGADMDGKAGLICMVTPDLTNRYKAGKIIGPLARIVGGGGGGKPDMAQAGGSDPSKLDEAIAAAEGQL